MCRKLAGSSCGCARGSRDHAAHGVRSWMACCWRMRKGLFGVGNESKRGSEADVPVAGRLSLVSWTPATTGRSRVGTEMRIVVVGARRRKARRRLRAWCWRCTRQGDPVGLGRGRDQRDGASSARTAWLRGQSRRAMWWRSCGRSESRWIAGQSVHASSREVARAEPVAPALYEAGPLVSMSAGLTLWRTRCAG